MLSNIISYLNGLLADTGYFSEVKGLSVLIKRDGKTFPAYYCNGEYEPATEFDEEIGLCYWRFRSEPTDSTIEAPYQVNKVLRRTYPLRLVCAVMRNQLGSNDNAYAEDSLSLSIEKVIKDKEKEVRTEARALGAQILWRGVITSAETMKNTELLEIDVSLQARMLFMGIDVDIVVDYQGSCVNDFCGVVAPTNLTATSGAGTIELSWTDNSDNETGFRLYRSTSPTGIFTLIATKSAGVTTHSDSTVSPWQFYFYKVAAFNTDAQSAYSNIAWSMTGHGTLRWDSVTGASAFSLPSLGETLGINLFDAAGGFLDVTITSAAHVPATDSFDIVVADQVFRDEDEAGITLSTEFNSLLILAIYNSDGTSRFVNAITGLSYSAQHLRIWVDEDSIGGGGAVTVNGVSYPSSTVIVEDEAGGQIGSLVGSDWVIPSSIGFPLLKTGQTDDFGVAGSDGDLEEGEPILTLRANNPFGHTFRFTGITGGYHDGTNYKDVNGTTTTQALAFPESVMLDWHQYDRDASPRTVQAYFIDFPNVAVVNWSTHISNAASFSTASFATGWSLANERQGYELITRASNSTGQALNYAPIFHVISGTAQVLWLSTTRGDASAQAMALSTTWVCLAGVSKTQASRGLYTRLITLTELGL